MAAIRDHDREVGQAARRQQQNYREQKRLPLGCVECCGSRWCVGSNPCQGRGLPHTRVEETVFLTPAEFRLLRDHIERERWKNLATWLVTTGMR
jgi:hypothetical protein